MGMIEDSLIRVDTFLVPVDFLVLAPTIMTSSGKEHVILLRRPLIKTVNMQQKGK